jgi:hypothetical protein
MVLPLVAVVLPGSPKDWRHVERTKDSQNLKEAIVRVTTVVSVYDFTSTSFRVKAVSNTPPVVHG